MPTPFRLSAVLLPVLLLAGCAQPADPRPPAAAVEPPPGVAARLAALPAHPRLFINEGFAARSASDAAADPFLAGVRRQVLAEAEALLAVPPLAYATEGIRLASARPIESRIIHLAMAWRLTGEARFAERARAELLNLAAFPDWLPSHFLDTAELTAGCAIGYDWLHPVLAPADRATIRRAIVDKGLKPSFVGDQWWVGDPRNWNQVCHAGLVLGALAVGEDEPELSRQVVERALANLPVGMTGYAPDGAYPEGPTYWTFGTTYQVLVIDALRTALGGDFGLSERPGFLASGRYMVQVAGPTGWFHNYSDATERMSTGAVSFWFARTLDEPAMQRVFAGRVALDAGRGLKDRFLPFTLVWADAGLGAREPAAVPALDWAAGGQTPVAYLRSGWDVDAAYVGIKGGTPEFPHSHQDSGSFVYDCQGVRWAVDLGKEDYHQLETRGVKLWDYRPGGGRWTVFRHASDSHNLLVFAGRQQHPGGRAELRPEGLGGASPAVTADCTSLHPGAARAVVRRIGFPGRRALVVEDRIDQAAADATVRWQMVTRAAVELRADGAELRQDGKVLRVSGMVPGGRWLVEDLAAPRAAFDSPNPRARMLVLEAPVRAGGSLAVDVRLEPAP